MPKVGENYGDKMMRQVIKAKGINFGEKKFAKTLDKINPAAQIKTQNVAGHSLNPKVYSAKYFGHNQSIKSNKNRYFRIT